MVWEEPRSGVLVGSTALANVGGVLDIAYCGAEATQVVFEAVFHARPDKIAETARQVTNTVADARLRLRGAGLIQEGYVHSQCDETLSAKAGWVRCTQSGTPKVTAYTEYGRILAAYQSKYGDGVQNITNPSGPEQAILNLPHKEIPSRRAGDLEVRVGQSAGAH